MKVLKEKILSLMLALAMVVALAPSLSPAYANETADQNDIQVIEGGTDTYEADPDIGEPEELFDGYLKMKTYNSSYKKRAGQRLRGANYYLYNYLNAEIDKIARGERESTRFVITAEELFGDRSWLASELGLKNITDVNGQITETAASRVQNFDLVLDALMADNPYAMYWFDKTEYVSYSQFDYSFYDSNLGEAIVLSGTATIDMPVAKAYSKAGVSGTYEVDTALGQSTEAVVSKAQEIVDRYSDIDDEEKLRKYADEICALVSYNHSAAAGSVDSGDPWQLIWVFDEDPDTNVVCEGYAKAYKFLCDLTDFYSTVDCITVTGDMNGAGHMWNIVTPMDGYNYLVDITNNDAGSKLGDLDLFMNKAPAGGTFPSYEFTVPGSPFVYTYDSDCRKVFSKNELLIPGDGTGHVPAEEPVDEDVQVKSLSFEFGSLSYYEGFDGEYGYDDYSKEEYVETDYFVYAFYDNYVYEEGNKITVNGKTYTCNADGDFRSSDGSVLPGLIHVNYDQTENHWNAENDGHVTITYKDASCIATIKIDPSPIKSFSMVFAKQPVLYGGQDVLEYPTSVYNEETGEYEEGIWTWYCFGDAMTRSWDKGDYLLVNGVRYDFYPDYAHNSGEFRSSKGKVIPERDIIIISGQSEEHPWGDGEHESTVYYRPNGKIAASCKVKVRVVEKLVNSIRFEPTSNFRVAKENGNYYFCYQPGDKFIIGYNDSRGEVEYTARYVITPNGYELKFRDADGKDPAQGEIYLMDLTEKIDTSWGVGEHPFYISYFGYECEFTGKLVNGFDKVPVVKSVIGGLPTVKISKVTAGKKCATVKWKKVSKTNRKKFEKIQIQYSTDKHFKKNVKTVTASKTAVSKKIKNLKGKKRYYFRIRAYTNDGSIKCISAWSSVRSAKIKK